MVHPWGGEAEQLEDLADVNGGEWVAAAVGIDYQIQPTKPWERRAIAEDTVETLQAMAHCVAAQIPRAERSSVIEAAELFLGVAEGGHIAVSAMVESLRPSQAA